MADASAIAEVLLRTKLSFFFIAQLTPPDTDIHVPELCDLEFVSVLKSARISEARAAEALLDYRRLPMRRHRHEPLLDRVLELRHNFSVYDACYVALAETIDATLLTGDRRLAVAVRNHLPLAVVTYP